MLLLQFDAINLLLTEIFNRIWIAQIDVFLHTLFLHFPLFHSHSRLQYNAQWMMNNTLGLRVGVLGIGD